MDWAEAYLLAQRLFELSTPFPKASNQQNEVIDNPEKPEHIWADNITVQRNEWGEMKQVVHYVRHDGGGRTIEIRPSFDGKSLMISRTLVAD